MCAKLSVNVSSSSRYLLLFINMVHRTDNECFDVVDPTNQLILTMKDTLMNFFQKFLKHTMKGFMCFSRDFMRKCLEVQAQKSFEVLLLGSSNMG